MVKFDLNLLAYLESDDFRVLTAVETGMRNHEIVPVKLVGTIAEIRSGTGKLLRNLCYNRLLSYERGKKFDGYRLTSLGYDYLALRVLRNRSVIDQVGNQIGVGKEASVYISRNSIKDERYALKVHRLGRTSFKTVYNKRDYHKSKVSNWLYLSRLAALREYSFMKILYEHDFKIPEPIDHNRHCIVMKWIDGTLLNNISKDDNIDHKKLLEQLLNMILELANKYGVVHGDFNEFNILIHNQTNEPYLIDFPQMVSTDHQLAKEYFERDVQCILSFFEKRFACVADEVPTFEEIENSENTENIIKVVNDENDMLHRYLEDNLLLSENFKDKMNLNDESDAINSELIDKCDLNEMNKSNDENELNDKNDSENVNKSKNMNEKDSKQLNDQIEITQDNKLNCEKFVKSNKLNAINEEQANVCFENNDLSNYQANQMHDLNKAECMSSFSYSASRHGSSIASTFTTDEIRSKLRKEKERKEKKELIKESLSLIHI